MTAKLRRSALALLVGVLITLLSLVLRGVDPNLLASLRGTGFDTLQRIWPREMEAPQPVRIVDIDEASLKELGQWPWPRDTLAQLTTRLFELGAAAVAFDIVFPEPDRMSPRRIVERLPGSQKALISDLPDHDEIFATALEQGPTVLAVAASRSTADESSITKAGFVQAGADAYAAAAPVGGATVNIPILTQATKGLGIINLDLAQEQGVARQIPFLWSNGTRYFPSLVPETLRVAQSTDTFILKTDDATPNAIESLAIGAFEIPLSELGQFYLHYRKNDPALYVPAKDILSPNPSDDTRQRIDGHIIYVGTSAVGLLDIRTSALGESIPGVSVHAQATEQILSGQFLLRPEWIAGGELLSLLICGIVLTAASIWLKPWQALVCFVALLLWLLASTTIAFRHFSMLVDITFPMLAATTTFLAAIAMRLLVTDREGRQLRSAFGHYVAPSVLAEIERNPQSLKLGGEMRDVTVMFVDIENFTPLSEKLPPQLLVRTVNQLLDAATTAILKNKGTIDKYIGDAVMAFWNAPVALSDHQAHAARAALDVRDAIIALNRIPNIAALLEEYQLPQLGVRVGLASGPACVGNMGSTDRFDYSVLGETVNIAARTESSCKHLATDLAIAGELTEATKKLGLVFAGNIELKGKTDRVPLHAIMAGDSSATEIKKLAELAAALRIAVIPRRLRSEIVIFAQQNPALSAFVNRLLERPRDFQ